MMRIGKFFWIWRKSISKIVFVERSRLLLYLGLSSIQLNF